MKPQLPKEIEELFPRAIIEKIYSFVPHLPKKKSSDYGFTVSPKMERDLRVIQSSFLRGKDEMWLRGLDNYVL